LLHSARRGCGRFTCLDGPSGGVLDAPSRHAAVGLGARVNLILPPGVLRIWATSPWCLLLRIGSEAGCCDTALLFYRMRLCPTVASSGASEGARPVYYRSLRKRRGCRIAASLGGGLFCDLGATCRCNLGVEVFSCFGDREGGWGTGLLSAVVSSVCRLCHLRRVAAGGACLVGTSSWWA